MSPRRPWVAALMSLVLPGFGQLYNGEPNKAIWLFFLFALIAVPVTAFFGLYVSSWLLLPAMLVALAAPLGIWVYAIVDGARQARRLEHYEKARWQVSGMYVLVFVVCSVLALPASMMYTRTHVVESFRVPARSMEPTILQGDFLFADKRYNCRGCKSRVRRGDIAVFSNPNDRTVLFLKRIIALPGDRVRLDGRDVAVNGVPLGSPDAANGGEWIERIDGRSWRVQWVGGYRLPAIELEVPAGEVFVLGDNRANSFDSRSFGTVPMEDVIGHVRQVWFSWGDAGVRWERIGTTVD
jgi:signal peptidase I